MATKRPAKHFRLNFTNTKPAAFLVLYGSPNEAKLGAGETSFISVKEDGITISPGKPGQGKVMIQAMPDSFRWGGMVSELPFPLTLLPPTFSPGHQTINPPMQEMMGLIRDLSLITSSFLGA